MATPATPTTDNLPNVVLVGRANVGKSTLFNKLIEERKALVSDIAGTTRTNNEGLVLWRGKYIRLIDTGGLDGIFHKETKLFDEEITRQVRTAIGRADVIVFVTDAMTGILPQEKKLAKTLLTNNEHNTPIILVANKVDNSRIEMNIADSSWSRLAFGETYPVSAANGRGAGDFLDALYTVLNKQKRRPKQRTKETEDAIRVSMAGKPNVGKSSLFNKLIGDEKVIVSPIAHTTRESFDTTIEYEGKAITFIDTAGIRRKAKVSGILERGGIQKTIQSIESSDIVLLTIDGSEPISSQDLQLGGLIEKRSKSVILLINKWDLTDDATEQKRNAVKTMIYSYFPHLDFAPILFVSGLTGYRVQQIFPLITRIAEARKTEITQEVLDAFLERITTLHMPSRGKGTRHPKILGMKQLHSNPPIFELTVKHRTSVHRSYLNYIENNLRQEFNFTGTPIVIKFTKTKK